MQITKLLERGNLNKADIYKRKTNGWTNGRIETRIEKCFSNILFGAKQNVEIQFLPYLPKKVEFCLTGVIQN